ncbi:hypothetical protein [Enterobacter cloacae]|uniref:hypothetical protein n=1 Tax=Enterobacter cloacae TaxID=550 RepID=UPI000C9B1023|nr:hypothetical protein [Enterobacter cloacae]NBC63986.1 hypothetical protein [Enterobacter cloacae]PNC33609.1 hypothetical protein CK475_07400 [Enterobacter cloacae]HEI8775435.1 hypothetical protein [Enterobacter cloacae]
MNKFERTRSLHQFYRDEFSRLIFLPETDALPAHIVTEILHYKNSDIVTLEPQIMEAMTDLDADKELAVKRMLCAIAAANAAFDFKNEGKPTPFSKEMSDTITGWVVEALQHDNSINLLVAGIQVFFRINEIDAALFLISNYYAVVSPSPTVMKILLLVCLMEDDFNQMQTLIQQLTANPENIGEDALTMLMIVTGIHKLGGCPESFIDFSALKMPDYEPDFSHYEWLLPAEENGKTTVLVACDKRYYFDHALTLLGSVYHTNGDGLNVHLHLYNPDDETKAHVNALHQRFPGMVISATAETITPVFGINVWYASRRFVFLSYALSVFTSPIMVLDADCLVRKNWSDIEPHLPKSEIVLSYSNGAPPWEQVPAGFVYTVPGTLSRKYLSLVATFIDWNLRRGNAEWFLDQVALSVSLDALPAIEQMAIHREPLEKLIDIRYTDDTFSWTVTTQKSGGEAYQNYKAAMQQTYFG